MPHFGYWDTHIYIYALLGYWNICYFWGVMEHTAYSGNSTEATFRDTGTDAILGTVTDATMQVLE